MTHVLTQQRQEIFADQVVVETGTDPLDEMFIQLRDLSSNNGVLDVEAMANWSAQPFSHNEGFSLHRLGDAVSSRSIHAAFLEAYRLAVHL